MGILKDFSQLGRSEFEEKTMIVLFYKHSIINISKMNIHKFCYFHNELQQTLSNIIKTITFKE